MEIDKKELESLVAKMMEEKEAEEKSLETEDKSEVKSTQVETDPIDMDKAAEKVAEILAEKVQEKFGGDESDSDYLREKLYSRSEGLKGVEYPSEKELANLSEEETIVLYFKSLLNRDPRDAMVQKVLSEGTAADGGNLVPTPLHNEIYRLLPDLVVMRQVADTVPMTSQTLALPTQTTEPVAYWIAENATKTTTSAEFGQVTLTCNKLVARIPITDELVADANVDIVNYIIRRFAEAIATAEDRAFFDGTGVGQPRGIDIEAITTRNTGATFDFDDVIALMDDVRQSVRNSRTAAFIGHSSVIRRLRQVKDTNGQYIWGSGLRRGDGETLSFAETIYGKRVYSQDDLPGDELYFGDWSYYIIGDRQQITVSTSREAADAWEKDQTEIKAVTRVDGRAVLLAAFAKLINV